MKKILSCVVIAAGAVAASIWAASNFPDSVSTDANLYVAVNNCYTTLTVTINASTPTITAASTTNFPSVGYFIIENEVIKYAAKTSGTFTGCTRGADGTSAATHTAGKLIYHSIVAAHHNVLKEEIKGIEDFFLTDSLVHIDTTNVRVGINNASPAYTLDVGGAINTNDAITAATSIGGASGSFSGEVAAATLNTGNGSNELFPMDQDVQTSATPTFTGINATYGISATTITSSGLANVGSIKIGVGGNEGYILTDAEGDGNGVWAEINAPVAIGTDLTGADVNGVVFANGNGYIETDSDFTYSTATQVMSVPSIQISSIPLGVAYGGTGQDFSSTPATRIPYFNDTGVLVTTPTFTFGSGVGLSIETPNHFPQFTLDSDLSAGFILTIDDVNVGGIIAGSGTADDIKIRSANGRSITLAPNGEVVVNISTNSVMSVAGDITSTGTVTADIIQVGAGSAELPSITSYDQVQTGISFPEGQNQIVFSILGVGVSTLTASEGLFVPQFHIPSSIIEGNEAFGLYESNGVSQAYFYNSDGIDNIQIDGANGSVTSYIMETSSLTVHNILGPTEGSRFIRADETIPDVIASVDNGSAGLYTWGLQVGGLEFESDGVVFILDENGNARVDISGSATGGGSITTYDENNLTAITLDRDGLTISDGGVFPDQVMPVDGSLKISDKLAVGGSTTTSAITAGGVIESTSGGFKFPDGSIQTKAMTNVAISLSTTVFQSIGISAYAVDISTTWAMTEDTWYKIPVGDDEIFTTGYSKDISLSSNTAVVTYRGFYKVDASVSFSGTGGDTYQIGISVNGAAPTQYKCQRTMTNDNSNTCSIMGIVGMAAGDNVSLRIQNTANSNDATISHISFNVMWVGFLAIE
jgi:hypothetical protein